MIQSPQQHYQRLTSLLRRIRDTPDASRELERWGLCLDTDIYRVRAAGLPAFPPGAEAGEAAPEIPALPRPRVTSCPGSGSTSGTAPSFPPRTWAGTGR